MLVWEILLGTERAEKGARRPRWAPQPETPAGKGVFSGRWGAKFSPVSFQARRKDRI